MKMIFPPKYLVIVLELNRRISYVIDKGIQIMIITLFPVS